MNVRRIEAFVRDELERAQVPGAQIAAVKSGEIVFSAAIGSTEIGGAPVTNDTFFPAMSITKTIIATALMQLHDRGLFELDDPANRYLDGAIRNEWEAESPVTIRQLLTHTSGLPEDTATAPTPPGTLLADHVRAVAKTVRQPGEAIVYANWGFDAIGVLIDRLFGVSFDRYVAGNVFAPLGMSRSILGEAPEGERRARGYYLSAVDDELHAIDWWNWPIVPTSPAGGTNSTAEDLGRFLIAHLAGDVPGLRPESVAEMHRVHASDGSPESGQGLGFRVTRANGRRMICHGGDGTGHCAILAGHPDEGVGVVLLLNLGRGLALRSRVANGVLHMLVGEPASRPPVTSPVPENIAGRYRSLFWNVTADLEAGPRITVHTGAVITGPPQASDLVSVAPNRFEANGGAFHGFEVSLQPDAGPPTFSTGLYPWVFVREGGLPSLAPLDEDLDLHGTWSGTADSPLGPMLVRLDIKPEGATVFTPLSGELPLEDFVAEAGRVSGHFVMTTPITGEMTLFPRLEARGGRLVGPVYAQGWFGEIAMPAELNRV